MTSGPGWAQEVSGALVMLQRQTGVDGELWQKLGTAFVAENPGVTSRELAITAQGDARGGMRTALTAAGVETTLAIPGKYWAHDEWFKTLLARTAGLEDMA